jgi:hypothetical protein
MTVKKHLTAIKVCRTPASPSSLLVLFHSRLTFAKRLRIVLRPLQGISEAKVDKVLEAINKEKVFSFVTGSQVLRNRQRIKKVRRHQCCLVQRYLSSPHLIGCILPCSDRVDITHCVSLPPKSCQPSLTL